MEPPLPPLAPFPSAASWPQSSKLADWPLYLQVWRTLAAAYLALPDAAFTTALSREDQSGLSTFVVSLTQAQAELGPAALASSPGYAPLKRTVFLLFARALRTPKPPPTLLSWQVLADVSRVYGRQRAGQVLAQLSPASLGVAEASLAALKKLLVKNMEAGLGQDGDLRTTEKHLQRVNFLVNAWPAAGAFFMTGSDYLDAMVSCYTIMNPPLRRVLVTSLYVSLIGLTQQPTPRYSLLSDLLFALRSAAEEHKKGPLRPSDSLVNELVSVTPILQQLRHRSEAPDTGAGSLKNRLLTVLNDLATYQQPGRKVVLPPDRLRRKPEKGKFVLQSAHPEPAAGDLSPQKQSQISMVQDLFPHLETGYVAKLLDEHNDDPEQLIAHLLEGNLPPDPEAVDRAENAADSPTNENQRAEPASNVRLPLAHTRQNIFDGDELDRLSLQTSKLHFGKHASSKTADDFLAESTSTTRKEAIWSALASFDADDDERDDTYDAADVGGTVDGPLSGVDGADDLQAANEQTLFAAYQATSSESPGVFSRDAVTRRSAARLKLREKTGMTDEAIEGWAIMLARNPQQRRRLELQAQSSALGGEQNELARTAWRAGQDDEDDGPSSTPRGGFQGRGRGGRGRGGGSGGGSRGGNVSGPTGEKDTEQARKRKEANKSSRANHNRRDQRARKMAKGGFPG